MPRLAVFVAVYFIPNLPLKSRNFTSLLPILKINPPTGFLLAVEQYPINADELVLELRPLTKSRFNAHCGYLH